MKASILDPRGEHGSKTTAYSCEVGCQEHVADGYAVYLTRSSELRTRVESEPSEPEDEYTESCSHEVVTRDGSALAVAILAQTRTKADGTYECQYTTYAVNDGRTCEVVEGSTKGVHHE